MSTEQISPERAKPDLATLVRRLRGAAKHPYMNNTCPANIFDVADAADRIEALEAALGNISRMKMFPDDTINRLTLLAAIEIARAALPHP